MGIPNLLRFMKPFIEPVHIKKYAGQRVGIDAYSWLHKGAYSCSMELCMNPKSAGARRYISYFMHHVNLLRHHKVVPVVVFDGGSMPCKSATDEDRHKKRELSLVLGKETLKQGNTAAAIDFFRKAVQITPSMAYQLIQILRSENVEFVVAPYEADAQLAYLASLDADQGGIAAVITEDSDLIAYGCTAMDRFGKGEEFIMDKTLMTVKDGLSFQDFDQNLFTGMCVLAGCDFLPSVSGIGTKRAYSLVSKHKSIDLVLSTLKLDKRYSVPDDYTGSFWKTLAVFNHARVYDVKSKSLKHLKPLEEQYLDYLAGDLDILGPELAPSVARAIAEGHLNPVTMETFDKLSRTISPIKFIDTSALNVVNQYGSQENLTQESSITLCSSQESEDDIVAFPVDEIANGERKCNKGGLALGKFLLPGATKKHSSPALEHNKVKQKNTPENNPFKKRKLPTDQGQAQDQNDLQIDLDDEEPVVLCSSLSRESVGRVESQDRNEVSAGLCRPSLQESVESVLNERSSKRQNLPKAFRNKTNKTEIHCMKSYK